MTEAVNWTQWVPPKLNPVTDKWEVKILDADGNLLETLEYATESIAQAEMRTKFIDNLLSTKKHG